MINHKDSKSGSILVSDRNAPILLPNLLPKVSWHRNDYSCR